jgi:ppGpp synthetase/RelA/SpoT-type nucleotidyltranferase
MFRAQPQSEDIDRLKKLWEEYVDYVKTRDKKIKAMEDQIRKKEKEIGQKNKLEEVLKTALS